MQCGGRTFLISNYSTYNAFQLLKVTDMESIKGTALGQTTNLIAVLGYALH